MELNAELPMAPSGWRVREALSYDLPVLWPSEYEAVVRAFEHAGREQRDAFLRRSGVRWCVLPSPSEQPIAEVAHWEGLKLVECDPIGDPRVRDDDVAALGGDPDWQRAALFDPSLRDDDLRVAASGAGTAGTGRAGDACHARIIEDGANDVTSKPGCRPRGSSSSGTRSTRRGGDGRRMHRPRLSARTVCIARSASRAGRHVIRFRYRPRALGVGLTISGMTALALVIVCTVASPEDGRTDARLTSARAASRWSS